MKETLLSWCCCSTSKSCDLRVRPPHLQEVIEVLEDADADLVQVFEEAIEDGHQVGRRQLVTEDHRQLVDGEGQRAAYLPLEGKKRRSHKSDFERVGNCYTTDTQSACRQRRSSVTAPSAEIKLLPHL